MKKLMDKENEILNQIEMANISGGNAETACGCGCAYEGQGGSSAHDNAWANSAGGKHSTTIYKKVITKAGHEVDM